MLHLRILVKSRRTMRGLLDDALHRAIKAGPMMSTTRTTGTLVALASLASSATALDNGYRVPPMGWSSWYGFTNNINETMLRGMADGMVSSGTFHTPVRAPVPVPSRLSNRAPPGPRVVSRGCVHRQPSCLANIHHSATAAVRRSTRVFFCCDISLLAQACTPLATNMSG